MYKFYNQDCINGTRKHIADNSVDLIITDPPYGISGDKLDKHYNRNESHVIDGYVEVPQEDYAEFSKKWIAEAARVLKPGGSIYIISGYTNLVHILGGLQQAGLTELNHIIWKYNFGVYTRTKYVSSHYHILYYVKPGGKHVFNQFCRFGDSEKTAKGGSANYSDREDVWIINRDYKPGQVKNKNQLPSELLMKIMQYSSNEGDLICDMFLGSFSTAKIAKGLNRHAIGFELNKAAFDYQLGEVEGVEQGGLLGGLKAVEESRHFNSGKKLGEDERAAIKGGFEMRIAQGLSKKAAIEELSAQFGRGYWSILRIIDGGDGDKDGDKQRELL